MEGARLGMLSGTNYPTKAGSTTYSFVGYDAEREEYKVKRSDGVVSTFRACEAIPYIHCYLNTGFALFIINQAALGIFKRRNLMCINEYYKNKLNKAMVPLPMIVAARFPEI